MNYYDKGGMSVKDIWKSKMSKEEFRGLCKGNALKYIFRLGLKPEADPVDDIDKAIDYLQMLKEIYKETQN